MEIFIFLRVLFTSVLSTFDVGTDILNSLQLLGIYGDGGAKKHWGILAMSILFLPSIFFGLIPGMIKKALLDFKNAKTCKDVARLVIMTFAIACWPLICPCLHIYALWHHKDGVIRGVLDLIAGGEGFFESYPQLVLQMHIIFRGYYLEVNSTTLQYITMSASFVTLAKAAIQFDIVGNKIQLIGWKAHLVYMLKVTPLYITSIIFRCTSLALTFAYFRWLAIIPTAIYVIELVCIVGKCVCWEVNTIYLLSFSNMGIISTGMLNTFEENEFENSKLNRFLGKNHIFENILKGKLPADLGKRLRQFIRISALVTFFHHFICLVIIIIMVKTNATNRYVGDMMILQDVKLDAGTFDLIFSNLIMVGLINLSLSLYASKSVRGPKDMQPSVAAAVVGINVETPMLNMISLGEASS